MFVELEMNVLAMNLNLNSTFIHLILFLSKLHDYPIVHVPMLCFNVHHLMTIDVVSTKFIPLIPPYVLEHVLITYPTTIAVRMDPVVPVPPVKFFLIQHQNVFQLTNVHVNIIVNFT